MLLTFVILYLAASIAIGLIAATRVHNTRDYVVAGRSLPLYVVTATVFATWFGSETVLGISSTFIKEGLRGIVSDPFGSSMCLVLVGFFFAAKLYRMDLLTIGDYYRVRYDAIAELLTSLCIVISYLGWLAAQIVVIGLVFSIVTGGAVSMNQGIVIGAIVVLIYTLWGGMYSVAWTNFVQMVVILLGLFYIAYVIAEKAGGVATVVAHADAAGKFEFWPKLEARDLLTFIGAWVTLMFGSIPQQDVFQRVNSSRSERVAVTGSVLGGVLYFLFAFVPIFLAYSASLIDPKMVGELMQKDHQQILPALILNHTPLFAQIVFFGALLSAVMSTASGTLLAPSVTFTENILKKLIRKELTDRQFLWTMRVTVAVFATGVTVFALNSESTIYEMVVDAYKVTLVAAFVPLVAGLYWKRATRQGALAAILAGLATWVVLEIAAPEGLFPPQLAGLLASVAGMIVGSSLPQWYGTQSR
ncbi:MAG: sodium:solute symporter family protein [Betaproteobacteria bacterium]|nr:sodium:solute symporter family protein [Betaproteobacteria bacterium]MDH3435808.1 sodium:solute symporter family protein [Betaproteobacteria bacterium]